MRVQEAFYNSTAIQRLIAAGIADVEQVEPAAAEMLAASFCEMVLEMRADQVKEMLTLLLEADELTQEQRTEIGRLLDI